MNAFRVPFSLVVLLLASVAAAPMRLPDVVYGTSSDAPGPVRFDHRSHAARVQNKCVACHPQTFRIVRPMRRTSHAEMEAGRSCGACHDGKRAFGVQDVERCEACHDAGGGR